MAAYRLFGAETSPFSLKVRSALRYKGLDYDWVARCRSHEEEFRSHARSPAVPLLLRPSRPPSQDAAAIIRAIEADHPEPPAAPEDPEANALSLLLEAYADDWLCKAMFQQRWGQMPDRDAAAIRVLTELNDGKRPRAYKDASQQIAARMMERLPLIGAHDDNAATLETSYRRFALRLDAHLRDRLFIFGGRPSQADFALAAQFQQMLKDPTPAGWLQDRAPFVVSWCAHMDDPKASGPYEPLADMQASLLALFTGEVSQTYLPWAHANAASAARGTRKFSVTLSDGTFEQPPQASAALRYKALKRYIERLAASGDFRRLLEDAGADDMLAEPEPAQDAGT
jgi:glutathione S-transferase